MKKLFIYIVLIGIFASCTKTGQQGPQGPTGATGPTGPGGPSLTNTITGYVFLYDAYGDLIHTGDSTAYALLYNTATGAKVDSINANSAGQYTIPNVLTGTYNLVAQCPGYAINKTTQNLVLSGGTETLDLKFSAIPASYATTEYDSIGASNVYVKGTIAAPSSHGTVILVYIGTTSSVSASVPSSYSFVAGTGVAANATRYSITLPLTTLYNYFSSGNTAYVAVYGAATGYTNGDYIDYATGNTVYTAVSAASRSGSFIVP